MNVQCCAYVLLLCRLERIVAVLLSTINGTTAWDSLSSTLHVIKEVISMMAHNLNAQAGTVIHSILVHLLFCVYAKQFDLLHCYILLFLQFPHVVFSAVLLYIPLVLTVGC